MKTLTKRWQIVLYGCAGMGLNLLNMIVGSYLCSALLIGGFDKDIENWTYLSKDLVIAALWGTLILVVKIVDGIIDIPLSTFTDNLRTRFGRRRPAILIGLIPLLISYVLFLFPLEAKSGVLNTVWFGLLLAIFYCSYTLTMVTYYATFAEIVSNDKDRVFLSNIKSICDVGYFSLSFALVPAFVAMGLNIRIVALIFLPLSLTMLIPLFLIKERSTKKDAVHAQNDGYGPIVMQERVGFVTSLVHSFKNKHFIFWLCTHAVMNTGLQLFLSGINEYFSTTGLNMTFVMASSFVPVPLTLILYNKVVKKFGLRFAFQYVLLVFSTGMALMYFCGMMPEKLMLPYAIMCGIIVSFGIGAFFSISYTIPSQLAMEENKRSGICASSMYFAVEGLFEGISAGLASGVILIFLKDTGLVRYMTVIVAAFCMAAFVIAFYLPESIKNIGKETPKKKS